MNTHTKGLLIATFGVFCLSFDALFIRLANTDNWNIFFWYSLFGVVFFTIYLFKKYKLKLFTLFLQNYKIFLSFGIISAFSGLCFISSVTYTQTANTVLILSTASFVTAIVSYIVLKEYTPLRVWVSGGIALIGVLWIMQGSTTSNFILGDILAIMTTISIAILFTYFRAYPDLDYMIGVYIGNIIGVIFIISFTSLETLEPLGYISLMLMGLILGPLSRISLHIASQYIIASELALILIIETILAPIWVWFVISEVPTQDTIIGSIFIFVALFLNGYLGYKKMRKY